MTSALATSAACRPGAVWSLALVLGGLALACGVNRSAERSLPPPAALPNLRRASEALQLRIAREREHVEAFSKELDSLRAQEERLYAELVDSEETYQRLRGDAEAAWDDVHAIEDELATAQARSDEQRAELDRLRLEQQEAEAALAQARSGAQSARDETTIWMAKADLAEDDLTVWRQRLEDFRVRWRLPEQAWIGLLVELGLGRLSVDSAAWEAAPAAPAVIGPDAASTGRATTSTDPGGAAAATGEAAGAEPAAHATGHDSSGGDGAAPSGDDDAPAPEPDDVGGS